MKAVELTGATRVGLAGIPRTRTGSMRHGWWDVEDGTAFGFRMRFWFREGIRVVWISQR